MAKYTNKELASDYLQVVAPWFLGKDGLRSAQQRWQAIALATRDIPEYYRTHGNLGLSILGVGPGTKEVLILILDNGLEGARRIYSERRSREMWQRISNKAPRVGDDYGSSWDNVVRAYES